MKARRFMGFLPHPDSRATSGGPLPQRSAYHGAIGTSLGAA